MVLVLVTEMVTESVRATACSMAASVTSSVAYDATVDATAVVQLQQAIADAVQLLHADANCSLRLKWLQALRRFCLCSSGLLQENVKNLVEQKKLTNGWCRKASTVFSFADFA